MRWWQQAAIVVAALVVIVVGGVWATRIGSGTPAKSTPALPSKPTKAPPLTKAAPPIPDQSAEAQKQLAELRAENERLKTQVQRPPSLLARATGQTGTIAGSAWLGRNSGASDILRGLKVELLPSSLPKDAVILALDAQRQGFLGSAKIKDDEAEKHRRTAATEDLADIKELDLKFATDDQAEANGQKAWAAKNTQAINQLPATIDAGSAYRTVARANDNESTMFALVARATVVRSETTGADGKFSFADVPQGNYYLYACLDTKSIFVEWIIPVSVAGSRVEVNLFNDNAAGLRNIGG